MIRAYLKDTINEHDSWSSKDSDKIRTRRVMCIKSNDIEIMMGNETGEVIEKQMKLLKNFLKLFCQNIRKD